MTELHPLHVAGVIIASALGWVVMTAAFVVALPYMTWVVAVLLAVAGLI